MGGVLYYFTSDVRLETETMIEFFKLVVVSLLGHFLDEGDLRSGNF